MKLLSDPKFSRLEYIEHKHHHETDSNLISTPKLVTYMEMFIIHIILIMIINI